MHIVVHAIYKPHRWNKKLNYEEIFSCQEIYSHLFLKDTGVLFTNSQVMSASLNKGLHSQKFARAWNIQVLNYVLTIPGVAIWLTLYKWWKSPAYQLPCVMELKEVCWNRYDLSLVPYSLVKPWCICVKTIFAVFVGFFEDISFFFFILSNVCVCIWRGNMYRWIFFEALML